MEIMADTALTVRAPRAFSMVVAAIVGVILLVSPGPDGRGLAVAEDRLPSPVENCMPVPGARPPQDPDLLVRYAKRPPWQVAGVDFAVGLPAGTVLKDPQTIVIPGVALDSARHLVRVRGDNVTLDAYDFALGGGWGLYVEGKDDTIERSNFKVGANNLVPIGSGPQARGLRVLRSTIDGGGLGVTGDPAAIWSLISNRGTDLTVAGNWLLNAPQHIVEFTSGRLVFHCNLIENTGWAVGAHVNDVQFNGGKAVNSLISYNTVFNPQPGPSKPDVGGEGLQVEAQLDGSVIDTLVERNTMIATGPRRTVSYLIAIHQDAGPNLVDGVIVRDNYLDPTGAYGSIYPVAGGRRLEFGTNIDMRTGAPIPPPHGAGR
jgi:hypothetical protein